MPGRKWRAIQQEHNTGRGRGCYIQIEARKGTGSWYVSDRSVHSGWYVMIPALHKLFSMSWEEGLLPEVWKWANVKFLRKAGKSIYYSTNSYWPISLTSCLVKILEKIITDRLEVHIEGNRIVDVEQVGFRKKHSTTNTVMHLVQSIFNGFEKDMHTAAIFTDLKRAYDTIWREVLVYKLNSIGISGRLLKWNSGFLHGQIARCILDQTTGPGFETMVGLPQGSSLSLI